MTDIKVGDTVRLKMDYADFLAGHQSVVTNIRENMIDTDGPDGAFDTRFEFVSRPNVEAVEPIYSKGDRVRYTGENKTGWVSVEKIGWLGTVANNFEGGKATLYVKWDDKPNFTDGVYAENVELAMKEKFPPKYPNGTKVEYTSFEGKIVSGVVCSKPERYDWADNVPSVWAEWNPGGNGHMPADRVRLQAPKKDPWQTGTGYFTGGLTLGDLLSNAIKKREEQFYFCDFIKQEPVKESPCIVAELDSNGKPRPNENPRVHATAAVAVTEAERLSRKHPGIDFATFQMVKISSSTKPVEAVTTTRAA